MRSEIKILILIIAIVYLSFPLCKGNPLYNLHPSFSMYDMYQNNSAFIYPDTLLALDFYGSLTWTKFSDAPTSFVVNTRLGLKKYRSGFLLATSKESYGLIKCNSLTTGYSYFHPLSDRIKLNAGFGYKVSNYKSSTDQLVYNGADPIYSNAFSKGIVHLLNLGIGTEIYGLSAGIGTSFSLREKATYKNAFNTDSISVNEVRKLNTSLQIKYEFNLVRKFSISPKYVYNTKYSSYFHLLCDYNKSYYLGITYNPYHQIGTNISKFILSLGWNIKDTVLFVLILNPNSQEFIYSSRTGFNLVGKIAVKL